MGSDRGALRREQEEPRFPAQGPSITNLPRRNLNFTGRTKLLEGLHSTLQSSTGSAVTQTEATEAISGLGGIGKTQLALEYAHRYASDYDLIWWIGAEQPTTVIAALAELAGRLGITERADQAEMVNALWEDLRGRDRWLLVFDNAEQPTELQPFLPPGGGGHVLVGWARVAVALLHAAFPNKSWEMASWPACQRLLPHVLVATDHAEQIGVASEQVGELLWRASIYIRRRGQPREARLPAQRAVAATEVALGPDAQRVGERRDQLGRVPQDLGDYQAAPSAI